jgi:Carboxypeptidase regulatory-like domain
MDFTGAVIPGADVVVLNEESKQNYSSRTDQAGQVQFPDLPSAHYDVSISAPEFMESHQNNVTVPAAITVTLRVGALMGEVVVTQDNPNPVHKLYRKIVSWF